MRSVPVDFPDVVRIETVGKCNFRCIHCPTGINPNNRSILSEGMFDSIVGEFLNARFIPRVVVLYHGGEPLLNTKLSKYIRVLKKMGVEKTVITTNASLLTGEQSRELVLAGLDEIKVSFDGQSPDENNHIRQGGDFYANAENVKTLCEVRKALGRNNPHIKISNIRICNKETLQKMSEQQQFMFQEPPEYLTKYFCQEGNELEFQSFPAMVWPGYERNGFFDVVKFETAKPKYCGSLFETTTILSNGDVVLCCYDIKGELVLGNITKESIFDIWSSKKYLEIREKFKKYEYSYLCEKCNYVSPVYLCEI